jgi:hypothetical protein
MATNPMKIRATNKDGVTEVKVLISHEMETGQRKDAAGAIVPAWFITELTAKHGDDRWFWQRIRHFRVQEPLPGLQVQGWRQG